MDPWKELAAREECRDAIRAWATRTSKRSTTVDDHAKSHSTTGRSSVDWRFAIGLAAKLAAWMYESWRHITRR
jgi:hypothetical protein